MPAKIDKNTIKKIENLYLSGLSQSKVAKKLSVSNSTVSRHLSKKNLSRPKFIDRTGYKQGRLTVTSDHRWDEKRKVMMWRCICSCGNEIWVKSSSFRKRKSRPGKFFVESCGCLLTEYNKKHNKKHGLEGTQFYKAYYSAKGRCELKKNASYNNYGGKGIKFKFKNFKEFKKDLYDGWIEHIKKYGRKNTSLDRINPFGNYEPGNCRWATWEVQNANKK